MNVDPDRFTMRAPCRCGENLGRIVEKNGQDTVRCISCNAYCYCAPRSVSTVHKAIRTSQRERILERATVKCELCGARGNLHVGHIISVEIGLGFGLTEIELNDDENLLCLCEECNLGMGSKPMPMRVAIVVLRARISWRDRHEATA